MFLHEGALHEIGDYSRIVPNKRVFGIRGFGADLLVGVTEGTTHGLGNSNLIAGFEEVLTGEDILGGKLTKVLLGSDFTGEERRGEARTGLHFTATLGGHDRGTGGSSRHGTTGSVHSLFNTVGGSTTAGRDHINDRENSDNHNSLTHVNFFEELKHLYIVCTLFF
jgi:hypothetical protein